MKYQVASTPVWIKLALLAIATWGCNRGPYLSSPPDSRQGAKTAAPQWFEDVTTSLGIDFVHETGARGEYFMPELPGSGVALFDYDNDGRLDVYLIQNGGPDEPAKNQLYHQLQDGQFKNVSDNSGLDIAGRGMGVACGDINNDGFPDVLVCEYGAVHLFSNNGGKGTFTEITKVAGIDNPLWASSATFFDYDRDGWLDLLIVNYIQYANRAVTFGNNGKNDYPGPSNFPGEVTKLYHNLGRGQPRTSRTLTANETETDSLPTPASGEGIRFEDVTAKSGLIHHPGPGLVSVCLDFDGDGWLDIFVADDGEPNRLFINQRNGVFKNEAAMRGISCDAFGAAQGNMGVAIGDVDGDGLFDVYVTHTLEERNILWKQGPPGLFRDCTAVAGLAMAQGRGTGFGDAFADFNNDGTLDLAIVNGAIKRPSNVGPVALKEFGRAQFLSVYAERNQLLSNDGQGKFTSIAESNPVFCATLGIGRSLAVGDINGDGGLDMLVTYCQGPAKLYRNVAPNRGHWLTVRAIEPQFGGRDAYGAKVTLIANGRRHVGWINASYSYQSSCDPRAHFGLGAVREIEAIEIDWPDGSKESFPAQNANQLIILSHGSGHAPSTR